MDGPQKEGGRITDLRALQILLVEDDADTRDVMARLLRRTGADVEVAASVGEALVLLGHTPFSHVLLDLMLPDADGVVLLQSIRRRDMTPRVALLTAAGKESTLLASALQWQPAAVFHKPVAFNAIEAWLGEAGDSPAAAFD